MLENKHENRLATDAPPEPHEIVLATIDDCLRVGNLRWRFIELQRERAVRRGLDSSYRTWLARYSEWMNPERRHYFPPHGITDAIEIVGNSDFLDAWLAQGSRISLARRRNGSEENRPGRICAPILGTRRPVR